MRGITASAGVKWLCLDADGIGASREGIRLVFAGVTPPVREELDRLGVTEVAGADAYFDSVHDVLDAYGRRA